MRRFTARTITEPDALTAELSATRASGVAREIDETRGWRTCCAATRSGQRRTRARASRC
ncbi:MAG TPA: IclR family transcriptional regulator C-terminal domain-containing protein [Actinoallomurus sp.]